MRKLFLYGVVSNGGNIIVDGLVDQAGKTSGHEYGPMCLCPEDMLASFNEMCHESWAGPMRMADDLFYYCIVERDKVPLQRLKVLPCGRRRNSGMYPCKGRKLYIVPQVVNKWAAMTYIRDILQEDLVVTAGDSLLDLCMLSRLIMELLHVMENYGKVILWGNCQWRTCEFTKQAGILAANDILDYVQGYLETGAVHEMRA